jgi:putative ABC transport system permease protein
LLRSFLRLLDVDAGFRPERRVALQLFVYNGKYDDPEQQRQFFGRLIEELEALPGVRSASGVSSLPLSPIGAGRTPVHVLGRAEPESAMAGLRIATVGYFETMGTPLVEGRTFTRDDRASAAHVAILNETAARRFFPQGDAVGSFLRGGNEDNASRIVGIVGDVRHQGLDRDPLPELFLPFSQNVSGAMSVIIETESDPALLVAAIQDRVFLVDPGQPIWGTVVLETLVARETAQERFHSLLVGLFAAVASVLAAVGLFGVLSYGVAQRTREIGLRMAVGASTARVLRQVLSNGALLLGAGVGAGLLAAVFLATLSSRLLAPLLFETSTGDPAIFAAASVVMAIVGLGACLVPALRASRIDPIRALRHE